MINTRRDIPQLVRPQYNETCLVSQSPLRLVFTKVGATVTNDASRGPQFAKARCMSKPPGGRSGLTLRAPTAVIAATLALVSATGCSATSVGGVEHDGVAVSGGGGGSSPVATGGQSGVVIGGDGGSPSRAPVTEIVCPTVAQDILVLDFRSGWWTGGGGGDFANTVLAAMVQPCANLRVEYHHFEVDVRFGARHGGRGAERQPVPALPRGDSGLVHSRSSRGRRATGATFDAAARPVG